MPHKKQKHLSSTKLEVAKSVAEEARRCLKVIKHFVRATTDVKDVNSIIKDLLKQLDIDVHSSSSVVDGFKLVIDLLKNFHDCNGEDCPSKKSVIEGASDAKRVRSKARPGRCRRPSKPGAPAAARKGRVQNKGRRKTNKKSKKTKAKARQEASSKRGQKVDVKESDDEIKKSKRLLHYI